MKLFKLTLLFAMIAGVAHADTGKISTPDEVGGKICEKLAAQALKQGGTAMAESTHSASSVREETKDSAIAL